ncbi:ParB/Sulfiredoxin [uncultured Caudovirales phage]|uniref:ParB/Sulfiredoxin n=1 Tax=uncultured Caudovirales phage TaxID=2100421 RepID=A0A6J5S614_9CAUD|nr:ParB/Sulfiredoxin [uncultured Caudovirales phage]
MIKVKVAAIKSNPKNPRLIKDDKFKKLVKSIKDFPEMESVRPIVVNKDMIILGGNMRYKAMIECGYKEVNVEVVDWSEEKQNEFIIKDNVGFGEWEWEMVANEWDMEQIEDWGLDLPLFDKHLEEADLKDLSDKLKSEFKIEIICKDEEEQEKTYNKLIEENYECRLLTL